MNKKNKQKERQHKLNFEIKHPSVRVAEYGIITLKEAQDLANKQELDLVLINENAQPPVCKIINYEKYVYNQNKATKQKSLDIKEIKLSYNIGQNDLDYRLKHAENFLKVGHKIKLSMQFRGREMLFTDKGMEVILKFILDLDKFGTSEGLPKLEGKKMMCTLKPKTKK
jgi:translation initiation factor IF-3